jgi:hypothetical protein
MDTLQLLIDSVAKNVLISNDGLTTHASQGQSVDLLDVLYKIGVILIALFNLLFSIYLYHTNKKNQKEKETKANRQNLLNILILNHKLDVFYKIFAEIHSGCKVLLDINIDENKRKEQANSRLEDLFIRLNIEFITTLRAVDIPLSDSVLNISDELQGKLSENIFDKGVNLNIKEKYDELIKNPVSDAEICILRKLYEFA